MTKQNGVDMRPNAAIWMPDELRSKVRHKQLDYFAQYYNIACYIVSS